MVVDEIEVIVLEVKVVEIPVLLIKGCDVTVSLFVTELCDVVSVLLENASDEKVEMLEDEETVTESEDKVAVVIDES